MHDSNIPAQTPSTLVAGDTWEWNVSHAHYSAADSWVVTYALVNSTSTISISTSANGTAHGVNVTAETTAAYAAGMYRWEAYATKAAERHRIGYGSIKVEADLAESLTTDTRSHARTVLDSIEAVIEGRATQDQAAYSITTGGVSRSLSRTPITELLVLRDRYKADVSREERAERLRKGLGTKRRILTRFS